ncbi:MAG TPA: hypothetical protein VGE39_02495 [Prosthecobacter sp.]
MKTVLPALFVAIILCIAGTLLSSCVNDAKTRQLRTGLAVVGKVVVAAAQVGGAISKAEADAIRDGGALILNLDGKPQDQAIAAISERAVKYAEDSGEITHEQAEELRKAGEVPLNTPVTQLLSEPVTLPMTGSK